jgi:hypothetical protein
VPAHQPVVAPQTFEPAPAVNPASGPADEVYAPEVLEPDNQRIAAESAVPDQDVARGQPHARHHCTGNDTRWK